ncbi:hypothetical protein WJ438_04540 [Streptomyces sp. GD-15H]|uniref:hypothetical protein n=1 Tax=Streptomyces sp. GD-15H TaxID=3129112 RepID=UPI003246BFBF
MGDSLQKVSDVRRGPTVNQSDRQQRSKGLFHNGTFGRRPVNELGPAPTEMTDFPGRIGAMALRPPVAQRTGDETTP